MNCELVRELEAAFALDALDEAERHAVAAHLEGCAEHPRLAEFRAVAIALASSADERRPPERLRQRVMDATEPSRARASGRSGLRRYAAVAVLLVVCLAGAGWMVLSRGGDGDTPYLKEFTSESGVAVRLEADFEERTAEVAFRGLTGGEEYHLWAIRGEDWLSMGRFKANSEGGWAGAFAFAIQEGDALCLTSMNPDQMSGPFGEPVFIETL